MRNALRIGDLLVMCFALATALAASGMDLGYKSLSTFFSLRVTLANLGLFAGFVVFWFLVFEGFDLYRSRRLGNMSSEFLDLTKAIAMATILFPTCALLFDLEAITSTFVIVFFCVAVVASVLMRITLRFFLGEARRKGRNLRHIVIVGCGMRGATLGQHVRRRPDLGYDLLGYIDDIPAPNKPGGQGKERLLGSLNDVEEVLRTNQVDEVLLALPVKSQYEAISRIIQLTEELGVIVRMPADFFRLEIARAEVDYLDSMPVMTLQTPRPSFSGLIMKRCFDFMVSLAALMVLSPLMAVIALAIKFDSRGPVLFRQERVGLNRRTFPVLKFRTMVVNAEALLPGLEKLNEADGAAFKIEHDPRITRLGQFLRKSSLDELPQLWNILAGEMSFVGPRPLPLRDVGLFSQRWQNRRFSVRPGLTCLWQAGGRHNVGFDEWMEMDLEYIDQWSFGLDLEILVRTVPAVLRGTGAS
jgi:exopolysaccharide biosynthesis polyprenyl glycosylphosphotransferase